MCSGQPENSFRLKLAQTLAASPLPELLAEGDLLRLRPSGGPELVHTRVWRRHLGVTRALGTVSKFGALCADAHLGIKHTCAGIHSSGYVCLCAVYKHVFTKLNEKQSVIFVES